MLKTLSKSPLARIGAVAGLLLATTAAGSAAPLPAMPQAAIAAPSGLVAPTEIRYVRHYRSGGAGRAFAGAALGLFGLGLGAAIANNGGYYNYYPYGYAPGYYPYYSYAPSYGYYGGRIGSFHHAYRGHAFAGRHFGRR